jgi:hypothetical protein
MAVDITRDMFVLFTTGLVLGLQPTAALSQSGSGTTPPGRTMTAPPTTTPGTAAPGITAPANQGKIQTGSGGHDTLYGPADRQRNNPGQMRYRDDIADDELFGHGNFFGHDGGDAFFGSTD